MGDRARHRARRRGQRRPGHAARDQRPRAERHAVRDRRARPRDARRQVAKARPRRRQRRARDGLPAGGRRGRAPLRPATSPSPTPTASPPTTPPASSWSAPGARTSGATPSGSPTRSPRRSAPRSPTRSSRTPPRWAQGIAAVQVPRGDRGDAYCQAQLKLADGAEGPRRRCGARMRRLSPGNGVRPPASRNARCDETQPRSIGRRHREGAPDTVGDLDGLTRQPPEPLREAHDRSRSSTCGPEVDRSTPTSLVRSDRARDRTCRASCHRASPMWRRHGRASLLQPPVPSSRSKNVSRMRAVAPQIRWRSTS